MSCTCDDVVPIAREGLVALGEGLPSQDFLSALSCKETITHISSGSRHAAVTCSSGRVYTLGRADILSWWDYGPIHPPAPVAELARMKIVQTACGYCTTFFLTDKDELYACGDGLYGSLGLGCMKSTRTPALVKEIPPVRKVVSGGFHTMILTTTGDVWGCGYNQWGELGLGHLHKNIWDFTQVVDIPQGTLDISCGSSHTALMTYSGQLLMTGCNISGQVGLSNVLYSTNFKPVPAIPMPISAVACGHEHTVVLTMDGIIFAFGKNITGCLGIGRPCDKSMPLQVTTLEGYTMSGIFAGFNHTALLSAFGKVFVCGQGEWGEFGPSKLNIFLPTPLKKLPCLYVPQIAFGRTYTLMLVRGKSSKSKPLPCTDTTSLPVSNNSVEEWQGTTPKMEPMSGDSSAHSYSCAETEQTTSTADLPDVTTTPNGHGTEERQDSLMPRESNETVSLTYWEKVILLSLECPVCFKVMGPPIYQCLNGHNMCQACRSSLDAEQCPTCYEPFIIGSNVALERLAQEIQLPCLDCLERMPVAALKSHARVCTQKMYSCPLEQMCRWSGRRDVMLAHALSDHPHQTWQYLPRTFSHALSEQVLCTDLLAVHDTLFTFHRKFGGADNQVHFAIRHIGLPEDASKFRCKLEFNAESCDWNQTVLFKVASYDGHSLEDIFNPRTCFSLIKDFVTELSQNEMLPCKISIHNYVE